MPLCGINFAARLVNCRPGRRRRCGCYDFFIASGAMSIAAPLAMLHGLLFTGERCLHFFKRVEIFLQAANMLLHLD